MFDDDEDMHGTDTTSIQNVNIQFSFVRSIKTEICVGEVVKCICAIPIQNERVYRFNASALSPQPLCLYIYNTHIIYRP